MPRVVTFGRHAETKPPGMLREVIWPQLALLDVGTNEGMINRILSSDGGNSRTLPRTSYTQFEQAPGHFTAYATGHVDEVTLDGETGIVSGKGWVQDSEKGREAALAAISKTLFHNSVDLAEVKVEWVEHGDFWDDDFTVDMHFVEWKFAGTTSVGKPAFADAFSELPDEIRASLEDDSPLVMPPCDGFSLQLAQTDEEITASAAGLPAWEYFHQPEPASPHPIRVGAKDERGFYPVCGNLALWNSCHGGFEDRCIIPPRPTDNYASFNRFQVLTDRGMVETGPISLKGGHTTLAKALDDIDNAWADVRITPGVHGPWMSGYVRPGVTEEQIVAARASGVSGHWKSGDLRAVVSVNAPGYEVPGTFSTDADGNVDELVASFPGCGKPQPLPDAALRFTQMPADVQRELIQQFVLAQSSVSGTLDGNVAITPHINENPVQGTHTVPTDVPVSPDAAVALGDSTVIDENEVIDENVDTADEDLALALELERS